jgi:Uma2 family endonuclease
VTRAARRLRSATLADLLAIPEAERHHEIIDGELVRKAMPTLRHGAAQAALAEEVGVAYGPRSRGRGPGGWIFATETEIRFADDQLYRPDVAGWRRERMPRLASSFPLEVTPDWVCEILSPSNAAHDLVRKRRSYHHSHVSHYWILDPEAETLTVYRWTADGYLVVLDAAGDERVYAEPFEAVELSVRSLVVGDDETSSSSDLP